jgi:integrase
VDAFCKEKRESGSWTERYVQPVEALTHLQGFLGTESALDAITRDDVIRWRGQLVEGVNVHGKRKSPQTVNKYLIHVGSMFRWARDVQQWINFDPTIKTKLKVYGTKARLPLTKDDLTQVRAAYRFEPAEVQMELELLLHTGARLSEIHQLQIRDFILDAPVPFIDLEGSGDEVVRQLKNAQSARKIPIHPEILADVREFIGGLGADASHRPFMRTRAASFGQKFTKYCRPFLKDKRKTLHSLRHTMSGELQNAGVQEYLINQILGHAQQTMSTGQYGGHVALEVLRDSLAKVSFKKHQPIGTS